ncbi:hypothetical protein Bpfe_012986, partial [Biomphalaria pfeifferi]
VLSSESFEFWRGRLLTALLHILDCRLKSDHSLFLGRVLLPARLARHAHSLGHLAS